MSLLAGVFIIYVLLVTPAFVFAEAYPVINEFSSPTNTDWIELYNPTDAEIDLSAYYLRDNSTSNRLVLFDGILPHDYRVFEWQNKLNNSGDTIKLYTEEQLLFELTYGADALQTTNDKQTIGRKSDGDNEWVVFAANTKGSTNALSLVMPTATPVPATPIPTIKPSKTPKPPSPIKKSTEKTEEENVVVGSNSKTRNGPVSEQSMMNNKIMNASSVNDYPTPILGISTSSAKKKEATKSAAKKNDILVQEAHIQLTPIILSIAGMGLIGCGILVFLRKKRKS